MLCLYDLHLISNPRPPMSRSSREGPMCAQDSKSYATFMSFYFDAYAEGQIINSKIIILTEISDHR